MPGTGEASLMDGIARREGADRRYIVRHINLILISLPQASAKPYRARSIAVAGDQSSHAVGGSEALARGTKSD
jgi:hypothetical protein